MKRLLLFSLLLLTGLTCFSQSGSVFVGISGSYSHNDLRDDYPLSSNADIIDYYRNIAGIGGKAGYFISDNSALLLSLQYSSDYSYSDYINLFSFHEIAESKTRYYTIVPTYRYNNRILGLLDIYCDFGAHFSYLETMQDYNGTLTEGTGFRTGVSVTPGVQVNLGSKFGISVDYALAGIYYTSIKQTDNSDVKFDPVKTTDYGIDMSIANLHLGLVFKF